MPIKEFELGATTETEPGTETGLFPARRRYLGDLGERIRGDWEVRTRLTTSLAGAGAGFLA